MSIERSVNHFQMFHGRRPRRVSKVNFHVPRSLTFLGKAISIEYECDKLNGGGDGTKAIYRHEFETPVIVCMDERAMGQLYIIGPQIRVTDRGIIK